MPVNPALSRGGRPAEAMAGNSFSGVLQRWAWSLVNAVQLVYTLLWTAGCILLALLTRLLTGRRRPALALARRLWAPGLLAGAGARLETRGLERVDFSRPHLFVTNHQSIIDIPALFRVLPCQLQFIVKRELRAVPFLGWYVAAMGMVFIDRRSRAKSVAAVHHAATLLERGRSIVSFAEGTRSRDGSVAPFKAATFVAAIDAGVPIVPIAIHGAHEVLPPSGFRVRPGTIRVAVGDPISTAGLTEEDRGELARQAWAEVVSLHRQLRENAERNAE